jgi:hypothetical protein
VTALTSPLRMGANFDEPTIVIDADDASAQTRRQSAQPVHVSTHNVHAVQPAIGGGR